MVRGDWQVRLRKILYELWVPVGNKFRAAGISDFQDVLVYFRHESQKDACVGYLSTIQTTGP